MAGKSLGTAYVQIKPTTQGIGSAIKDALTGSEVSEGSSLAGSNIVSTIKNIIIGAGLGKVLLESLNAGGAIQQSFGGIDTIYKGAEEAMKSYAATASSLGISANTYAEQAVSFGAALKQSFGGDAVQAAEAANLAITDMADNAAKMGTDVVSIQNAYQGFAKQNYTMLDNLKLGYGGTKTEMQRLIADANKLKVAQGEVGNLSISSYGDIVEAIHLVQKELGVSGTAADEASRTFTGSLASVKASFTNVLAALTGDELDLAPQLESLITNVSNFMFNNLLPMVGRFITSLPTALGGFIKSMIPQLMSKFNELTTVGVEMINNISSGLAKGVPNFLNQALPMILQFAQELRSNFGQIVDAGLNLLMELVNGIVAGLPTLIEQVPQIIVEFCGLINDNMPKILAGGMQMLITLVQGIINSIPVLIENIPKIFEAFVAAWGALNWMQIGSDAINWIVNGIQNLFANIPTVLQSIGTTAWEWFCSIDWLNLGSQVINFIGQGLVALMQTIPNLLKTIGNSAMTAFKSINWLSLGSNIINGIVSGLASGIGKVVDKAKEVARSALDAAKSFLGIKSPSREFKWIGQMVDAGFVKGLDSEANSVTKAMQDITDSIINPVEKEFNIDSGYNVKPNAYTSSIGNSIGSGSGFNQTVNVYAPEELSASEVARQTRNATRQMALALARG